MFTIVVGGLNEFLNDFQLKHKKLGDIKRKCLMFDDDDDDDDDDAATDDDYDDEDDANDEDY